MSFFWRYEDNSGASVPGPDQHFEERVMAEEWLGEHWRDLADRGVDQVTLVYVGEVVYGPMSLHSP
ncbi:hypothetical protein ACTG9Q_17765 [Actinokineospora sp. 24-640]